MNSPAQIRQLESENRALRDDLGFFEKLIPSTGAEGVAIRGLQAEVLAGTQLKWQVLVIQPVKNAPEFRGKLELSVSGTLGGKPWTMALPGGAMALQFRQYRRVEGRGDIPQAAMNHALVKNYSIVGVHWGLFARLDPAGVRDCHAELTRLAAAGAIRTLVSERLSLAEVLDGIARLAAGTTTGRIVFIP